MPARLSALAAALGACAALAGATASTAAAWSPERPVEAHELVDALELMGCGGSKLSFEARTVVAGAKILVQILHEEAGTPGVSEWEEKAMRAIGCLVNAGKWLLADTMRIAVSGGAFVLAVGGTELVGVLGETFHTLTTTTYEWHPPAGEVEYIDLLSTQITRPGPTYGTTEPTGFNYWCVNGFSGIGTPQIETLTGGEADCRTLRQEIPDTDPTSHLPLPVYYASYHIKGESTPRANFPEEGTFVEEPVYKCEPTSSCEPEWEKRYTRCGTERYESEVPHPAQWLRTNEAPVGNEYCNALPTKVNIADRPTFYNEARYHGLYLPATLTETTGLMRGPCPSGDVCTHRATHGCSGLGCEGIGIPEPPPCVLEYLHTGTGCGIGFCPEGLEACLGGISIHPHPVSVDPPAVPELELPTLAVPVCKIFPFGAFCWLIETLEELDSGFAAPHATFTVAGDELNVNAAEEPYEGIMEILRPVLLFAACIGITMAAVRFAMSLGANAPGGSDDE